MLQQVHFLIFKLAGLAVGIFFFLNLILKKIVHPGVVESEALAESPSSCSTSHHHQAAAEPEEPLVVAASSLEPAGITVDLTSLDRHQCDDESDSTHSGTYARTEELPELDQSKNPPEDSEGSEDESHEDPEAADPGCIVVEEDAAASPDQ